MYMSRSRSRCTCTCARLLLLATLPALAGREWWSAGGEVVSVGVGGDVGDVDTARSRPRFGGGERTAHLVARGQPAHLVCRLYNLHDKTVSWVRSRDLQIVCHAGDSFTADARVSCSCSGHGDGELHALHVDRARPADSGMYECQVNTEPKMSRFYNLTVVDEDMPRVVVEGGGAVRGGVGGVVTVSCEARYTPPPRDLLVPALHVRWSRGAGGGELHARGGVSLESEAVGARVTSRLTLTELRWEDDGEYTCTVHTDTGNVSDTVTVHVTDHDDDEHGVEPAPAPLAPPPLEAMQRDEAQVQAASCARARPSLLVLVLLLPATLALASPLAR